jgi:hypothetical protein
MDQEKYCSGEKQHGVRLYRKDGAGEIRAGKVAAGKFREVSAVMNFLMLLLVYYTQFRGMRQFPRGNFQKALSK